MRTAVLELCRNICRKVKGVAIKAFREGWVKERWEWGRLVVVASKGRGLK